jgi:hypothetical protein
MSCNLLETYRCSGETCCGSNLEKSSRRHHNAGDGMPILLSFFAYLNNLCQLSFDLTEWFYNCQQGKNIKG